MHENRSALALEGVAREVGAALEATVPEGRELAVAVALARVGLIRIPQSRTMLRPFAEALVVAVRALHGAWEADGLRLELARRLGPLLRERVVERPTRAETPRARSGIRAKAQGSGDGDRRDTLPVRRPVAPGARPSTPAPPSAEDGAGDVEPDPRSGVG